MADENYSKKSLRKLQYEVCSKLTCNVCPKYSCTSLKMYDEHLNSKKHLRRKFRQESESVWYCEACQLKLPNENEWIKHLTGRRHDKAMTSLALKVFPTCKVVTPQEISLLDESFVQEEDDTFSSTIQGIHAGDG
ncbi:uncharacterized protein LOC114521916 [Dendronephthya gigantea]|uniref:uncharacterized protein LOC114521916 n=1 Tax=Dendronephthya gigantea TaxID=151771 RepID=UPI00106BEDD8|nr:uncharacterized protein LOC114521916 [Dendronephthya gigantea]